MNIRKLESIVNERFSELEVPLIYKLIELEDIEYDSSVKFLLFEVFFDQEKTNISIQFRTLDENKNDILKSSDINSFANSFEFINFKFYKNKLSEEVFSLGLNSLIFVKFYEWFENCWNQTENKNLNLKTFIMFHDCKMYELRKQ